MTAPRQLLSRSSSTFPLQAVAPVRVAAADRAIGLNSSFWRDLAHCAAGCRVWHAQAALSPAARADPGSYGTTLRRDDFFTGNREWGKARFSLISAQGRIPYLPKVSPMPAEMAFACAMSASPSEVFFARILSIPRPYRDQASRGATLRDASKSAIDLS